MLQTTYDGSHNLHCAVSQTMASWGGFCPVVLEDQEARGRQQMGKLFSHVHHSTPNENRLEKMGSGHESHTRHVETDYLD